MKDWKCVHFHMQKIFLAGLGYKVATDPLKSMEGLQFFICTLRCMSLCADIPCGCSVHLKTANIQAGPVWKYLSFNIFYYFKH